ncbi:hypothetical protein D6T65_14020 [Arthrobacter frigidicola]|uniref:DUF6457 domain-containing protein n=1 Tax=Arthrobacter crusticola TaxID=2547960 RepID=A0A4R5TZ38_9MICC|nr:DUF6457 domain-containing protein [Arthrobacter crusticola]RJT97461.1 hypothetical protein D6T65_14020 [Arthrobacter frigidicola]TDK26506.1 hypothetical protein E2F48_04740 [Arthrobacter crusticola]
MTTSPDAEERELSDWSRTLTQALQILDLEVDSAKILEVADRSSAAVSPNAGAISAFLVGYAAGTVNTKGRKGADEAVQKAASTVLRVLATGDDREEEGWTGTAQ